MLYLELVRVTASLCGWGWFEHRISVYIVGHVLLMLTVSNPCVILKC